MVGSLVPRGHSGSGLCRYAAGGHTPHDPARHDEESGADPVRGGDSQLFKL
jgi:hypothetical protein